MSVSNGRGAVRAVPAVSHSLVWIFADGTLFVMLALLHTKTLGGGCGLVSSSFLVVDP